jgi:transposase-like protein
MLSLSTHTVLEHLNNIVEQEHRAVKRRLRACQGFRCFHAAWRTLQGIETMNIICGEVSDADLKAVRDTMLRLSVPVCFSSKDTVPLRKRE